MFLQCEEFANTQNDIFPLREAQPGALSSLSNLTELRRFFPAIGTVSKKVYPAEQTFLFEV